MNTLNAFIESGLIESYVLGLCSPEESTQVETMASLHPEIQLHLDAFVSGLEHQAFASAIAPPPEVKANIFKTITENDFSNKVEKVQPPLLHSGSLITDFNIWVNDPNNFLPANAPNIYVKPITDLNGVCTSIVWIKNVIPEEVHLTAREYFLVIEGSCRLLVEDKSYCLSEGDYFSIPLGKKHSGIVSSDIPCKVILQRVSV